MPNITLPTELFLCLSQVESTFAAKHELRN